MLTKKKKYYNSILTSSNNKTKTTWNIVKSTLNMKPNTHNITSISVNGNVFSNGQVIAETFNKYFVTVAQNIHANNYNPNTSSQHENPISYLCRAFNQPFPTNNFKYVSSKEIGDITKSLKTKKLTRV
jgi:hypothetical protein